MTSPLPYAVVAARRIDGRLTISSALFGQLSDAQQWFSLIDADDDAVTATLYVATTTTKPIELSSFTRLA